MITTDRLKAQFKIHPSFAVRLTSFLVTIYGFYIVADTLFDQFLLHHRGPFSLAVSSLIIDLPLLIGLSIVYLGIQLRRRKRTAWTVTALACTFYLGVGLSQLINNRLFGHRTINIHTDFDLVRIIIFPVVILLLLYLLRRQFVVKSDIQGFRSSLLIIACLLIVTLFYGVAGFTLMDQSDFHQQINFISAVHYTVDQFNLTVTTPVQPYTHRATLFIDSLSFVSSISLIYAVISLFQPLRVRFYDQRANRDKALMVMNKYGSASEEFFKLWPHDKQYFFDDARESFIAFSVYRGIALCVSDPAGNPKRFKSLLQSFSSQCFSNGWLPAFIHVSANYSQLYEANGFSLQRIGQEAVVDLDKFENKLSSSKYFRQISNRFNRLGYSFELLKPPHNRATLNRLRIISDEWLSQGNRSERGFAMGYYTDAYMQLCNLAVARDARGIIQAYLNIIPADSFDKAEATYDLLRQSHEAPGNINDYLLMNLISALRQTGFKRLNMGLSPLAGMESEEPEQKTFLDNVLKFAYANGDPFYSFNGLYKFKQKYQPDWQYKYVAYKNGLTGFSRTMAALTRYMSKSVRLHH